MRCSTTHRLHCSLFFVQTCDDDVHRRVEPIYTVWDDAAANLASIRHLDITTTKHDNILSVNVILNFTTTAATTSLHFGSF